MKFRIILSTAVLAAGLSFAGAAAAGYVSNVTNICVVTPVDVKTVNVGLVGNDLFEYSFQTLPSGPVHIFVSATMFSSRKFALPAGAYKLTYKQPSNPMVFVYNQNVVVKPYQVAAGRCVFLNSAEPARHQQQ